MASLRSFDFRVAPCGPDMLLRPLTGAGRRWAWNNLPASERRLGPCALIPSERIQETLTRIMLDDLSIAPLE